MSLGNREKGSAKTIFSSPAPYHPSKPSPWQKFSERVPPLTPPWRRRRRSFWKRNWYIWERHEGRRNFFLAPADFPQGLTKRKKEREKKKNRVKRSPLEVNDYYVQNPRWGIWKAKLLVHLKFEFPLSLSLSEVHFVRGRRKESPNVRAFNATLQKGGLPPRELFFASGQICGPPTDLALERSCPPRPKPNSPSLLTPGR